MSINVFRPKFHTEEILNEIKECLDLGWTGMGFKTLQFEEKWKQYSGLPFAHFINSNTSGLHLAINMLKRKFSWNDGDEVITTPLTFVSTNHVILYEKLVPVFADVDEYLCLDPKEIASKISAKTRAVMYVGMGGNSGKLDEIVNLCQESGLKLILDAAHMAGTRYHDKHIGTEADVTVFSFQAVKNLPTADSGMICWKDEEMDKWVRRLSWLGISTDTFTRSNKKEGSYKWKYDIPDIGYKYHGNSIMASIGLIQLKYLDEDNEHRNMLANLYDSLLEELPEVIPIRTAPKCYSARHLYQIRVDQRNRIVDHFNKNNIYPSVHYNDNSEYPMYKNQSRSCQNVSLYSNQLISLPLHLYIAPQDIKLIVDVLKNAINNDQ